MPSTRPGRRLPRAISPIGIDEVLLAKTAASGITPSTSASTRRFSSRSSNTASITRSARAKPLRSRLGRDAVHALAHLAQRQASALAALVVDAARLLEPAPERLERGVLDPHRYPGLRGHARDPRAHQPGAQHAQLAHFARRRSLRDAGVLLDLLRREEDRNERPRLGAHREPPEGPRLERQPFREARRRALLDHLERHERRRVVAARLREHRPARPPEDERPQQLLHERDPLALGPQPSIGQAERGAARHVGEDGRGAELVHEPRAERPLRPSASGRSGSCRAPPATRRAAAAAASRRRPAGSRASPPAARSPSSGRPRRRGSGTRARAPSRSRGSCRGSRPPPARGSPPPGRAPRARRGRAPRPPRPSGCG